MGKYDNLYEYLRNPHQIKMTLTDIEEILGSNLPPSAKDPKMNPNSFWRGEAHKMDSKSPQVDAWYGAGWDVEEHIEEGYVIFKKSKFRPVRRMTVTDLIESIVGEHEEDDYDLVYDDHANGLIIIKATNSLDKYTLIQIQDDGKVYSQNLPGDLIHTLSTHLNGSLLKAFLLD